MGAWGEGPYDNDDACDFLAGIGHHMGNQIVKALDAVKGKGVAREYRYMTAIAAVQLLVSSCRKGVFPNLQFFANENEVFPKARRIIDGIIADEDWVSEWSEPKKVRLNLLNLRAQIGTRRRAATLHDAKMRKMFGLPKKHAVSK